MMGACHSTLYQPRINLVHFTCQPVTSLIMPLDSLYACRRWADHPRCCLYSSHGRFVAKVRNYEGSAKFVTHFNSRVTAAEAYKHALPDGMAPDASYIGWIKSQPWPSLLTVSAYVRGGGTARSCLPFNGFHFREQPKHFLP